MLRGEHQEARRGRDRDTARHRRGAAAPKHRDLVFLPACGSDEPTRTSRPCSLTESGRDPEDLIEPFERLRHIRPDRGLGEHHRRAVPTLCCPMRPLAAPTSASGSVSSWHVSPSTFSTIRLMSSLCIRSIRAIVDVSVLDGGIKR